MTERVTIMLLWWGLAALAGWFLLPASVESLEVAVKGLAEEVGFRCPKVGEPLKVVGAAAVLVVLWCRTTPRFAGPARHHGLHTGHGTILEILYGKG